MGSNTYSLVFLQYLTTVFDNIKDAILLIGVEQNDNFRLLMCNEAFVRNTGYAKDDVGKTVAEVVTAESLRSLLPKYKKVIATKRPLEYMEWYTVPLGHQAYEVKLIPIMNAVGDCVQIAVITNNITELCMLREEIATLKKAITVADKLTKARVGGLPNKPKGNNISPVVAAEA